MSTHRPEDAERQVMAANTAIYRNLHQYLKPGTAAVVNVTEGEDVDLMFYNNELRAHGWCPSREDFDIYVRRGVRVAVFPDHGNYIVPDYVLAYPNSYLLPLELRQLVRGKE